MDASMAVLPFPPNCYPSLTFHSSSSTSLHFIFLQSQNYSAKRFGLLRTQCSRHTIHVDTHQNEPTIKAPVGSVKKKRKPRPSFFEQIQDKWSLKLDSSRQKFPWQEREDEKEENVDLEQEQVQQLEQGTKQEELDVQIPSKVSAVSTKGPNFAPWVLGYKPQSNYDARSSQVSAEERGNIDGSGNNDGIVVGKTKNSGSEVSSSSKFDRIDVDVGSSMPIQSENKRSNFGGGIGNNGRIAVGETKYSGSKASHSGKNYDVGSSMQFDESEKKRLNFEGDSAAFLNGNARVVVGEVEVSNAYLASTLPVDDEMGSSLALKLVDDVLSDTDEESINLPWSGEDERKKKKISNTYVAERTIPEHELKRLRNIALRMLERIKVGKGGITEALVESIHEKWKVDEVVKLKFESALSVHMKRTHETLESRTGGLVIWRSGSSVVLYRGLSYKLPCVQTFSKQSPVTAIEPERQYSPLSSRHLEGLSTKEIKEMNLLNQLLDELGPRFKDWSGREPVPVDADLLPPIVPDYKTPFRLLPHGVRHCLRDKEMTRFRQLARTTPPHFALGRNRRLQGLARAMVKLWETSAIAKIAIKRGVQNTSNDRMAEELKNLTGGTLLSRNKEYIVFYRGNDFLPPDVTSTVKERLELTNLQQIEEEQVRQLAASAAINSKSQVSGTPLIAGTLKETLSAIARWGNDQHRKDVERMRQDSLLDKHAALVRALQNRLSIAKKKFKKAEYSLAKVQKNLQPSDLPSDLETITDEERFLFRKIGLSMKPFLLVGRRGMFGGTVENMHLHWKHRELVKLIVKSRNFQQVKHVAINLEAESGGVLISLDNTTKGYAIILYRGKNYQQPHGLKPKNLLTKRQALAQSIELQRREALKRHILDLQERIDLLKSELKDRRAATNRNDDDDEEDDDDTESETDSDLSDEDEGEDAYDTEDEDTGGDVEDPLS